MSDSPSQSSPSGLKPPMIVRQLRHEWNSCPFPKLVRLLAFQEPGREDARVGAECGIELGWGDEAAAPKGATDLGAFGIAKAMP
jgi:hypothetical protein